MYFNELMALGLNLNSTKNSIGAVVESATHAALENAQRIVGSLIKSSLVSFDKTKKPQSKLFRFSHLAAYWYYGFNFL